MEPFQRPLDRRGQEGLPAGVLRIIRNGQHPDLGSRPMGLIEQLHVGLLRCAATLFRIAGSATADHILPGRPPSLRPWNHMIQTQLAHRSRLTAILALMAIPRKKVLAVEPHRRFGQSIVKH